MTYRDLSESHRPPSSSARNHGEMSCATSLFIALLLIPLIFGGTLFLLNEVGQAYFDTDPIALPPQLARVIDRFETAALPAAGETDISRSTQGEPAGEAQGFPSSGNSAPSAAFTPEEPIEPDGTGTQAGGASTAPSAALNATPSPTATGTQTASLAPTSTSTRTPTSSATHPPTATLSATATSPPGQSTPSSTPVAATATSGSCTVTFNNGYEGTVLELINEERQDQGLPAYTTDSRLRSAALVHATDMACNDFFSHTGSDGSSPAERVSAQGYSWSSVGENIYAGSGSYGSPSSAFQGWMNSPGHRANILSSSFTQIGVGYVYFADSQYRNYYVTVFATPH